MRRASANLLVTSIACLVVSNLSSADAATSAGSSPVSAPAFESIATNAAASDASGQVGDYGDIGYADPGFQDDRKPRYPIDTERHIRAAWSYIHQAHNASMYTADQLVRIRSRIIAAWRKTIDPDGPPSAGQN